MTLPELFKLYLQIQKASQVTIKNYLVDINHFLDWISQKTGIKHQIVGKAIFGLFTEETINEYKNDLLQGKIPSTTVNRRLSTLRKFGQFGLKQGWLTENPANKIANLHLRGIKAHLEGVFTQDHPSEVLLENFQKQLQKEKISPITIKNYLSDLKHFLGWLESS